MSLEWVKSSIQRLNLSSSEISVECSCSWSRFWSPSVSGAADTGAGTTLILLIRLLSPHTSHLTPHTTSPSQEGETSWLEGLACLDHSTRDPCTSLTSPSGPPTTWSLNTDHQPKLTITVLATQVMLAMTGHQRGPHHQHL